MYRLDDALSAYQAIIADTPMTSGQKRVCWRAPSYEPTEDALKLLPEGTPVTRDDWIAWLLRGMAMMRRADRMAAAAIFERGSREVSGYERDRFLSALAAMRLRQGHYDIADRGIAQVQAPSLQPTVNVLRLHIAGRLNRREQAIEAWRRLEEAPPHAVCIELGRNCGAVMLKSGRGAIVRTGCSRRPSIVCCRPLERAQITSVAVALWASRH